MPTKKPSGPPSPEAREHLIQIVRSSSEPLPVKALVKLLQPPHKLTAAVATNLLEEEATAGRLFQLPPAKPAGPPRYWDRDAQAVLLAAALEAVQKLDEPQLARELAKTLVVPFKVTEPDLVRALDQHVAAGVCYTIRPTSAKGKPRYSPFDLLEFGRREILTLLESKGAQPHAKLIKALKGFSDAEVRQVLDAGFESRQLWKHPPLGKSKVELIGKTAPSPLAYLRDVGEQLTKIIAQLRAAHVPQEDLRRSAVQLLEKAGIEFGGFSEKPSEHLPAAPAPVVAAQPIDLIGLMRRLEPGADRGALVGARDLRRAAQLDKSSFDRAVLELARHGRLSLHRHDFAASLNPEERNELVTDGAGTYYVGMALRSDGLA